MIMTIEMLIEDEIREFKKLKKKNKFDTPIENTAKNYSRQVNI